MPRLILFCLLCKLSVFSQITPINTGTKESLAKIWKSGNRLDVAGTSTFNAKSFNEFNSFNLMSTPNYGQGNYRMLIDRIDTSNYFLLANNSIVDYKIYKSSNSCKTWNLIYDTVSINLGFVSLNFFDTNNVFSYILNKKLLYTNDNGDNWSFKSTPFSNPHAVFVNGDSTILISQLFGGYSISQNRGKDWYDTPVNIGLPALDFKFIGKDTIIGITEPSNGINGICFQISVDAGRSWKCHEFNGNPKWENKPDEIFRKICFKNKNEIYLVGRNGFNRSSNKYDGYGVILKSNDFGSNWSTYITPYQEYLNDMVFLNDSAALVCGDNGLLFKINLTKTIFTSYNDITKEEVNISYFPNPISNELVIKNPDREKIIKAEIINSCGQLVQNESLNSSERSIELNLKHLPSGLYNLILHYSKTQKILRIVKE